MHSKDKRRVFITGAAGFIGFHLAQKLHQCGVPVLGFDNFNDYYSPQLKKDRLKILNSQGISVAKGDICDQEALLNQIKSHQTTHLVHLAAQAGVRYSLVNPQVYVKSNVEGFINILEACRQLNLPLTYASSSSVYGLNEKIPFSEQDRTDHPASFYGATKKANELAAATYHHLYKIPVTGLRFFTVYGPWGRPDMAYYSFCESITQNKPIDLFNYGKMRRDFTYIDDIIDGIIAAINLEANCEIFNLGNNRPEELITFVEILEKHLGIFAKKNLKPIQPGDVISTYADIDYSRQKLGFSPKTSLEKGLGKFVDWYKSYHN